MLQPKGIFVKALTFKQMGKDGKRNENNILSVLVFACEEDEIFRLKQHAILNKGHCGDPNWACLCCPCHADRVV